MGVKQGATFILSINMNHMGKKVLHKLVAYQRVFFKKRLNTKLQINQCNAINENCGLQIVSFQKAANFEIMFLISQNFFFIKKVVKVIKSYKENILLILSK